jgi:hypothetical protein
MHFQSDTDNETYYPQYERQFNAIVLNLLVVDFPQLMVPMLHLIWVHTKQQ